MDITNKKLRKADRKLRKCQHIIETQAQISCCSNPTKNIAICNAGLVNGLSAEIVIENFRKFGAIENVVMPEGKSYCFLTYRDLQSAVKAFTNINGILHIAQDNKPVYLAYTETVPLTNGLSRFSKIPPGVILLPNFVSESEEILLLSLNDFSDLNESQYMKHRKVKHYGYEFRYDINNVDKDKPLKESIPDDCNFLWPRLSEIHPNLSNFKPDQLTVNHYKPNQGIPPHVDTHSAFEDPIMSLSLNSDTVMEFKSENEHLSILLPRRSLLIMSGESRYNWTHGITPRKFDIIPSTNGLTVQKRDVRVSFTFRKLRTGKCDCEYRNNCDSFLSKQESLKGEIEKSLASRLEQIHVHEVYDNVASHFSETRSKPWPNVLNFVNSLALGSILVDVGCGNGKYLRENKDLFDFGCDRSQSLLDICRDRGYEVFSCDCLYVPLRDQVANAVISIAVIHHLATEERRLQAIKEIVRILSIGGEALIYVWAKNQMKDNEKSSYLKQDRKNRTKDVVPEQNTDCVTVENNISLPVHTNRKEFLHKDLLVPWKLKCNDNKKEISGNVFLRFYHVFDEGELENLCRKINNIVVKRSYYDQGNWCVIMKRIS